MCPEETLTGRDSSPLSGRQPVFPSLSLPHTHNFLGLDMREPRSSEMSHLPYPLLPVSWNLANLSFVGVHITAAFSWHMNLQVSVTDSPVPLESGRCSSCRSSSFRLRVESLSEAWCSTAYRINKP